MPLGRFDGLEYYGDDVQNSKKAGANRAGSGWKGVTQNDNKFEGRMEHMRRWIRHQNALLATIKAKRKGSFPHAVQDGDPNGGLQVLCYGDDNQLAAKEVIACRQVITAYYTDFVTRTTANTADGKNLTAAQIEAVAVATIKLKIDNGDYDKLPQTL